MIGRLRTFPLPTRSEWAAFWDHSLDAIGWASLLVVGIVCIGVSP